MVDTWSILGKEHVFHLTGFLLQAPGAGVITFSRSDSENRKSVGAGRNYRGSLSPVLPGFESKALLKFLVKFWFKLFMIASKN